MTTTFDLRTAFVRSSRSSMPKRPRRAFENDVDEIDTTAGKEGKGQSGGSTRDDGSSDTGATGEEDPSSLPADNAEQAEQDDKGKAEEIRDPEGYIRSAEAAKYRRERNEMRTQVEELKRKLEGKQSIDALESTVRSLRLELAFERSARGRISDVEAAWRLAADDLEAVEVKDGQADQRRLEEIVDHVAKRYPYLVDDGSSDENFVSAEAVGSSGRPVNGKRKSDVGMDRQALEARFPALRRMR